MVYFFLFKHMKTKKYATLLHSINYVAKWMNLFFFFSFSNSVITSWSSPRLGAWSSAVLFLCFFIFSSSPDVAINRFSLRVLMGSKMGWRTSGYNNNRFKTTHTPAKIQLNSPFVTQCWLLIAKTDKMKHTTYIALKYKFRLYNTKWHRQIWKSQI